MDAVDLMRRLAEIIDGHRWDDLARLLAPDFTCHLVHTGERLDRDGWVHLNATYPGFERYVLEDCLGHGDRAAARAHVTGTVEGRTEHFAVAEFLTARDGLAVELTEVWADLEQDAPAGRRPS